MAFLCLVVAATGCSILPDLKSKPQYHNPFPQISRVAILPFRNQSEEPTLSGFRVSQAYYNELQSIPGFEVLPLGVVEQQMAAFETRVLQRPMMSPLDFQQFARHLGVDAVLQGAVTDYSAYYPPRMTLKVNWYAANPGFHPIPAGYGLPWGTKKEKKIPEWIRLEAERALAREQMKSQTPERSDSEDSTPIESNPAGPSNIPTGPLREETSKKPSEESGKVAAARIVLPIRSGEEPDVKKAQAEEPLPPPKLANQDTFSVEPSGPQAMVVQDHENSYHDDGLNGGNAGTLPADWPDPQGFIPPKPSPNKPQLIAQFEPIISHMKAYNGNDEDFTHALSDYYYFRDDARVGGWQSYLQRSEDFIRFCCHQHVIETLEARGGQLESRMILRWPISRYER